MRVLKDPIRHDQLERWLAVEILSVVKAKLAASGVSTELIPSLAKDIAVGVSDLWDGCHGLTVNGELLSPFLVFACHNDDEDVLVRSYDDAGSFLHDHVASVAGTQSRG
jgi:hypothetical protein